MCKITIDEFTPSLCLSRPVVVDVDPKQLAKELAHQMQTYPIDNTPFAERNIAALSNAIIECAQPKAGPGSEYVVWDPLNTLNTILSTC